MRLIAAVVLVFVLLGCSDDDGSSGDEGGGWLETWAGDGFTEGTYEGQPVLVDEEQRMLYIEDCDAAREATGSGVYEGYGFVCE